MTRVLVVGAGSAGARHARHLGALGATVTVTDPDGDRASAAAAACGGAVTGLADGLAGDRWDGIVVASPNVFHADQARQALRTGARVLVEKPLAVDADEAEAIAAEGGDRLAVAYNLRFHPPVERLVAAVHGGAVGAVQWARLWFGQWLPDWRPGVDYRGTYSARRELGGGVLLDASHELDLLLWLLGAGHYDIRGAVVGRVGPLEIDVEDTAVALLTGPRGEVVTVSLDYLSRRYRRGVEVGGAAGTARLDWARQVLEIEDAGQRRGQPAEEPVADSYVAQARRVLGWFDGGPGMPVGGAAGALSVRLVQRIRSLGCGVGAL